MKQQLKNILIPILTNAPVSSIAKRLFGFSMPIFTLHRMATEDSSPRGHSPAFLRQSLQWLKDNGHSFVSLEDVFSALKEEINLPSKPVAFTIDDGFHDHASIAAPIFLEFNCPVTIFLITDFIDQGLWPWFSQVEYIIENAKTDTVELDISNNKLEFNIAGIESHSRTIRPILESMKLLDNDLIQNVIEQLSRQTKVNIPSTPPEKNRPMTWDTARNLEKKGIRFGPHTASHPILSTVNSQRSEQEITDSWKRIQEELTKPLPVFCYPNGRTCDYGAREIELIKKAGLIGAVSTIPKQVDLDNHSDLYKYNLPRHGFPNSIQDLIQYSTWIENVKSRF